MDIVQKIYRCCDYRSFTKLDEDLQKIGLSIQLLNTGQHILCRIEDGRPVANNLIDDYLYLERQSTLEEITSLKKEVIIDFIERNQSTNRLSNTAKNYHIQNSLYGRAHGV